VTNGNGTGMKFFKMILFQHGTTFEMKYKNSSVDEIANVNVLTIHVEASAYAHSADFLSMLIYAAANQGRSSTSFIILRGCEPASAIGWTSLQLIIYAPTPIKPNYQSLFGLNNRWIIAQIILIWSQTIKSRFWNPGRPRNCFTKTNSRSLILVQIDFLLVINTNLPPILHRFRDIAFNRSKIAIFHYPSCV